MFEQGRQVRTRIRAWKEQLLKCIYTPFLPVNFSGFITTEELTPDEAEQREKRPFTPGEKWGMAWEYGWFSADVTIPPQVKGKRIVLLGQVGGEQMVFCNGKALSSIDKGHQYVTLTRCAEGGERFHLLIETYAGHGPRLENMGPCLPETKAVPPVTSPQCEYGRSALAVWNEEAYQLTLDVLTLDWLLETLPDKSLRAQKVAQGLEDMTYIVDFNCPEKERTASFIKAREHLRPLMEAHNGTTAPLFWLIGQSHIDLAWLWTRAETRRKSVRTYSNQLYLMEEYPEYRFLLCEPALIEMLKKKNPETYERVLQAVRDGKILPDGAFYVECDTNMPSGESLIRQLLWGKRWYKENVDTDTRVAWQPDTFGFSAALPQIMRKLDIPYFASQKLTRVDPECEKFPYTHYIWEGMDGSEVLTLNFTKNNSVANPAEFMKRWETDRAQQTNIDVMLYPYGFGDGGGGPTRDMVELARRLEDLEGVPRSHYGSLREYFELVEKQGVRNRWVGEMYLNWHRGTYTSQRRQKMLMRRAEEAMRHAEALAALENDGSYAGQLHEAWETILFNQFHDVASGVGIRQTHLEATAELTETLEKLNGIIAALLRKRCGEGTASLLYNPLTFDREEWYRAEDGSWHYVKVPAMGTASLNAGPGPDDAAAEVTEEGIRFENRYFSFILDHEGCVKDLTDKENGLPLQEKGQRMNDWRLYRNDQISYDAWEMDRLWKRGLIEDPFTVEVALTKCTPGVCEATVTRRFSASTSVQVVRVLAGTRRIDFETQVTWQERRKLLKVHFESNVLADNALHEIQFGYVARPAHDSKQSDSDKYECVNHRYSALCEENRGFAVMNNGIYGLSTGRGEMALTLLRAPLVPDDTCDRGDHSFTYSLYPFAVPFAKSGVTEGGYCLNEPFIPVSGAAKAGAAGISCDSESVVAETLKTADDGSGMILRLYESKRMHSSCCLHLPGVFRVEECGMDESGTIAPVGEGSDVVLTLKPFEIKTLRLVPVSP